LSIGSSPSKFYDWKKRYGKVNLHNGWVARDTWLEPEDARRVVGEFVNPYNEVRLHSAIGFVTPREKLEGQESRIFAERDRKLAAARENGRRRHTAILEPEVGEGHPLAVGLVS